ncbi:MAG: deoxyribose-phosphate aldolase [Kosmotoga sp.]|nr:MAG: deoxyribose-phosphate aldolase [Kosmotoga sp.]
MDIYKEIRRVIEDYENNYSSVNRNITEEIQLNHFIDHTQLKAQATPEQIINLCKEAKDYDFEAVCINSSYLPQVNKELEGTDIKKAIVVGFPLGAVSTSVKTYETRWGLEHGADEFDVVINIGHLKAKEYEYVLKELREVVKSAGGKPVKVIIETALLNIEEKIAACVLARLSEATFVKTSTGFSTGGATVEDVSLMKFSSGGLKVKASGGIRTRKDALSMIKAGADRIGTSSGIKIVAE